jgi:hypothetical protein
MGRRRRKTGCGSSWAKVRESTWSEVGVWCSTAGGPCEVASQKLAQA